MEITSVDEAIHAHIYDCFVAPLLLALFTPCFPNFFVMTHYLETWIIWKSHMHAM